MPAGAMPGRVRATIPLNDPLRRLPSNVTTFKVSDMIAPLDHDAGKTGQLRDKVFSMGKLVKRIRRADGSRARCCASARLRQSPPLASYSQTFSEPMFGVAAMDHTSSDSASHTASIG